MFFNLFQPIFFTCFAQRNVFPILFCVEISGTLRAVLHEIVYSNLDGFGCLSKDLKQAEPNGNSPTLSGSR